MINFSKTKLNMTDTGLWGGVDHVLFSLTGVLIVLIFTYIRGEGVKYRRKSYYVKNNAPTGKHTPFFSSMMIYKRF